jgi:hypothetical protein
MNADLLTFDKELPFHACVLAPLGSNARLYFEAATWPTATNTSCSFLKEQEGRF